MGWCGWEGIWRGKKVRNEPEIRDPVCVGHAVLTSLETFPAPSSLMVLFGLRFGMLRTRFWHKIMVPAHLAIMREL